MSHPWNDVKVISDEASNVSKYVFEKADSVVEAVLYRYPDYQTRTVICCSTQSGCPIGCRFCGSGDYFVRSLTAGEIVAQPVRCIEDTGVDPASMGRLQIMFMSMGEPMLNMKALAPACEELYALDSTRLKRENADLRRQLAEKESLLANARETNVAHAARILTLERVLRELCQDALKHPYWPLLRWVKFGPMAGVIEQFRAANTVAIHRNVCGDCCGEVRT